jgi:tRNA A37 methylthiotransferase MiaB
MKRVGLVQINSGFSGQHYFPYSVGLLQAYANAHLPNPGEYEFLLPIYRRIPVADAVRQLKEAEMVFFSVYGWNVRLSLAIAEALKRQRPEVTIVFGGPQVPRRDRAWEVEAFLRHHPFVDLAVHGAGEETFVDILQTRSVGGWDHLLSVSFISAQGRVVTTPARPGLKDLNTIPSPYASGVFDPLMAANPHERWIGVWETNRNCPFSCTFCGWGQLESKPVLWDLSHVFADVDWFARHQVEFIFCADANFGLLPRDLDIAQYVAKAKRDYGYPHRLSVQDTKNVKQRALAVRRIFQASELNTGVVISLQSLDPVTLKAIRRDNIKLGDFRMIQAEFAAEGIETMTDLILGLAGETYESFVNGISNVIAGGQHHRVQYNNCVMVPDAEMSHRDYRARHGIETVWTEMVNIHGVIESEDVKEMHEVVIATAAMPHEDWVKARAFAWMTALLHFDKLLQIPLVLAHEMTGASYRELFEIFTDGRLEADRFPILTRLRTFFEAKARDIQNGGVEFCYSAEWLGIHWPADEYAFIELAEQGRLGDFYREAETALARLLMRAPRAMPLDVLSEAIALNQKLVKLPFQTDDDVIALSHNVWEVYRSVLVGKKILLEARASRSLIPRSRETWLSWNEWCEKVVWFCNKRGAYLYGNEPVGTELAGHF